MCSVYMSNSVKTFRDLSMKQKCETIPIICYIEIAKNLMNTIHALMIQTILFVPSAPHKEAYCAIQMEG